MAVWAKRKFSKGTWGHVQDLYEKHYMGLRAPADMLMISANAEWNADELYVALPDKALLSMYEGFEEVGTDALPKAASLLVGSQSEFEKRFQFPSS